jgi:site-specific DNA-methyltransferase (adenine-specific)
MRAFEEVTIGSARVIRGDCRDVLPSLGPVDAVVTDPPYGLEFMGKDWDMLDGGLPQEAVWKGRRGKGGSSIGDDDKTAGSRHRVALGGKRSGFKCCTQCGKRQFSGSPCRCENPSWIVEYLEGPPSSAIRMQRWHEQWARAAYAVLKPGGYLLAFGATRTSHRMACAIEDAGFVIQDTIAWIYGQGFPKGRTQLKPAHEPIIVAYRPGGRRALSIDECKIGISKRVPGSLSKTPNNIYGSGLGGYRQNGTESGHNPNLGRWPANLAHDGSDEVMQAFAAFGQKSSGRLEPHHAPERKKSGPIYGNFAGLKSAPPPFGGDTGTPARFFYCAKASKADRAGSRHPTVKPQALMRWLVALVTPPGGMVLDPFAGSGSTGQAALAIGRKPILIEREAEYFADIRRRIEAAQSKEAA